ncbi:hypothetical protein RB597_009867 [Gaeumannomyces tritici]
MKFGRNLPRNQVPEWASAYIDYKGLKKLIKAAAATAQKGEKADLAEFFFALDRNLEDVDAFYNRKFADACRRLRLLHDRYGSNADSVANLDEDEVEELMGAMLDLRTRLRNLQWFGDINRRGFVKITKKLDKKVPDTVTQHRYIATRVDPLPFAKENTIVRLLNDVNKWLSVLGDAQNIDDARSDRSARSLGRASAKAMMNFAPALIDKLDGAIRSDDMDALKSGLAEGKLDLTDTSAQSLLLNLVQRSISARSRASISFLLGHVKSLDDPEDINGRNCIHRLVIHIGRSKTTSAGEQEPVSYPFPNSGKFEVSLGANYVTPPAPVPPGVARPQQGPVSKEEKLIGLSDDAVQTLSYLLDTLKEEHRPALAARDSFGRTPLHYAAQFGIVDVSQLLMARMQAWGQFDVSHGIDAPEWQDNEGSAPLHLSVIGGHALTTKALLQGESWQGPLEDRVEVRRAVSKSSAVLAIATKHNHQDIVKMLVEAGVDINWQDKSGETSLHIAARFGHDECAKILLKGSDEQRADLELAEKSFAWTPLHIAAVDGHLSVAQLLVDAGADVDKGDSSGWTAKEHAALRGHMPIARLLAAHSSIDESAPTNGAESQQQQPGQPSTGTSPPEVSSLGDRRSNMSARPAEPIRAYGHRYLKDQTMILVSLGSMDMRKHTEAVKLDRVPLAEAHTTQLDTALSLVISATGAQGESTVVDLPVHENICTEPVIFQTTDVAKVKLLFDIVPTYSGNEKNKIGRGVALLSSLRPSIGAKRMSLQGDVCVPILASNLDVIGSVHFNFLVITPFAHPNMEVTSKQTYWKKMSSTMVIGHRGLGKNLAANKSLQLGENTVPSFIAAANLGANYVEFDVQLTKDHIPVIYHDFLVSETGIDAPVHTLTLEQFLHINPDSNRSHSPSASAKKGGDGGSNNGVNGGGSNGAGLGAAKDNGAGLLAKKKVRSNSPGPRQRSQSMGWSATDTTVLDERMKHTRDFKLKGYKGNSRGNFIQAPFATLEDLFHKLPEGVGFNIEMKYPMLHESEEHEMDAYAVELNSFCDTVLAKVYDLAGPRNILFSSFNPDICLCLSFKQPNFPILFLTDAGTCPVGDVRASSLQEAIRFASRWNLLGVVSQAEPFVNSPRMVRVVKQHGLVCVSYGTWNNDPIMVQRQVKEGIDAVIVDSVLAIRKGLTQAEADAPTNGSVQEAVQAVADTGGMVGTKDGILAA